MSEPTYMTRQEAAEHLRWDVDTVDRYLAPFQDQRVDGKIRYVRMNVGGKVKPPRLLRADVYAILPREVEV